MKKLSSKAKIIIFFAVLAVALIAAFAGRAIARNNRITEQLTRVAVSYGLKDVKISIGKKISGYDFYDVTVDSSNFGSLSYNQMYSIANSVMGVDDAFVSAFTSKGDSYEVYPSTKSIYKNGTQIDDDYWNSETHKSACENSKNKYDYGSSSSKSSKNPYPYTSKKQESDNDDPYNAKDYSTEEDFYDDHYDDFFDYEEAEDYYREHTR